MLYFTTVGYAFYLCNQFFIIGKNKKQLFSIIIWTSDRLTFIIINL